MNITVLGANGKTGLEVVKQALENGHSVHALVRNTESMPSQPNLKVIVGDATSAQDVAKVSQGTSVIISALGAMSGSLMTDGVTAVIASSTATGVKRFILMSSFAVRKNQLSGGTKFMTGILMGKAIKDKSESEDLLRSSDLEWTIVYATALTTGAKSASVRIVPESETVGMKNKISRADVAAWMLDEAHRNAFIKNEVLISA